MEVRKLRLAPLRGEGEDLVRTPQITKRQAEQFLRALRKQCHVEPDSKYGPKLVEDWDWTGYGGAKWSIIWEEGPFQWTYLFPYGGVEEEFGLKVPDVSERLPAGFYAEAITSWAIGLYPI